ncbi:methionine-rich copper-binding protein CopC [Arthrobacter sp. PvP102]|uniref:copper resistance CopC family protein n=1 Tax=unclassified Arthrobacter TaxID=235627 RepID=UPI001AE59877|nr:MULTISPECIES: copper resistance CopC family protein [unclassified Arthrobacter]MBP1233929.1 methionine-rich copper-binding protein CopC [Arthrobacter sp. PvP103]MBP1239063.1 methionine-rich copper-binding protein CopC [Arthrobacter sp. PvP102]
MRSIRHLLSALIGALFFTAAVLAAAAPASAHDAAESSSPAQSSTVATPPEKVSVTFNRDPLALGSQFQVKDAAGTNWAEGPVEIVDNVASQKLRPGAPAGEFTVVWRVVSSDSHPIEGTFTFTATAAAPGSGATASTPGSSTTAGEVPTAGTAQPGTTTAPEPAPDASEPFPWSLVLFAGTALGILVALGVLAKRNLKSTDNGADDAAGEQ